jgi:molecular chaperone GrpE
MADMDEKNEANEVKAQEEEGAELEVEEETIERLRKELEEARAEADKYLDGWQRVQAEFANYRKRREAERQRQIEMSNAELIRNILPVLDDLERALRTLPPGLRNLTWVDGIFLVKRKLDMVLEAEGAEPIETEGRAFDPMYHEAVTYEEAEGYEEGEIIDEVQRGYMLGERVIRPALVRVARAPEPSAEEEAEETEQ